MWYAVRGWSENAQTSSRVIMAVLVREQIIERLQKGELKLHPAIDAFQMQMHAIDLRIGFTFLVPKLWTLTEKGREALLVDHLEGSRKHFEVIELEEGQYFELLPNEFITVSTLEKITMPSDVMGILYPRSSVNRQGLSVDLSGIIDAGYEGTLVIPVRNNTPSQVVRIYPGERFCQVVFQTLEKETVIKESRYHGKDITQGVLPEKNRQETRLIRKGDIKGLKGKYGVEQH